MALSRFAFLGGDEHHAVGTTATVDGRGRGILKDFGTGNVGGTEEVDVVANHAIDHIYWVGVVHGADATDAHLRPGTRLSAVGVHRHTGGTSLQGLIEVGGRRFLELVGTNRGHRPGEVALAHGAVAHHHQLVEQLRVLGHAHVDGSGAAKCAPLGGHAHKGEHQRALAIGRDFILAIVVGGCGLSRALHGDGDSWQRRAVAVVNHRALDLD